MPKVPPELLQKIKEAVNIIEIVGEHVVLRKSGSNYTGLCPFHNERSPSFSVSEAKQVYHCYGCKAGGDVVSFITQMHGLSFIEAVQELADRAKIPLPSGVFGSHGDPSDPETEKKRNAERERLTIAHRLNRFAAAFFRQNLEKGIPAGVGPYLQSRGLTPEWEQAFYLGSVSSAWDSLSHKLVASKAPLDLAEQLGLVRPSPKGTAAGGPGYFDLFRNRVMFPILDFRGKIAGFGGRTLPGEKAQEGDPASPKYLNSPDSFLFHKSKVAFGLYQAAKHIREKDEVVLVEGYFDVLALHRAGIQNAVATCGTALSSDHLSIFRRIAQRITLLFDGDRAGVQAMDRAMVTALEQGIVVYGAFLPEGIDPDEFVLKDAGGPERLGALISQARPLLDVRIEQAVKEASQGAEQRVQSLRRIAGWLAPFRDPVGREIRVEAVCRGMGIPRSLMEQALKEAQGTLRGAPRMDSAAAAKTPIKIAPPQSIPRRFVTPTRQAKLTPHEKVILAALAQGDEELGEIFSEFHVKFPPNMTFYDLFEYPSARDLALKVLDSPPKGGGLHATFSILKNAPETLLEMTDDLQVRSTISEALVSEEPRYSPDQIRRAFHERLCLVWARFSQRLKLALAEAEAKNDVGLHAQLMKDYLDVQRKMKELNHFYDKA